MMNILIDGRTFCRNAAGITTFLKSALWEWAAQWKADSFFVILPKRQDSSIELPERLPNIFFLDYSRRFPRKMPNILILQLLVPRLCHQLKIDFYYSPVPHLPWGIPKRVKTFITIHDVVNIEMAGTMAWTNRLSTNLFFKKAIRKADYLWTNSNYTKGKVEEYFPQRKCQPILVGDSLDQHLFHPLDLNEEAKAEIRKRFGILGCFILFVGSLEPRKNLPFLISLMPELFKKHGIQLVVVGGKGWKNSAIKTLVEAPDFPKASTIFCGYVSNKELVLLYNTADCFVSAALAEGFGMPQLEALKCGCPVVTAHNTAMIEVAEGKDGAVTVEGYDSQIWIDAILQVLHQRPVINQAQLEEYDWVKIIQRLTRFVLPYKSENDE